MVTFYRARFSRRPKLLCGALIFQLMGGLAAGQAGPPGSEPRLVIEQERTLYYVAAGHRLLVKRLGPKQDFQGVAIVDEATVFLGYSGVRGEASTLLSVFDVRARREHLIVELGDTGESEFSYNRDNDFVVFDWYDGVYLFSLRAAVSIPAGPARYSSFEKGLIRLVPCAHGGCFEPQWDGPRAITYLDRTGPGDIVRRLDLPPEVLAKARRR